MSTQRPIDNPPPARAETWVVFVAAAGLCLVAGAAALRAGRADWDALAALSHALDIVRREPRFNLALIGFVAPPLLTVLYLPFAALTPGLAISGWACPVLGSVATGLTAWLLNALGARAGLPRLPRWLLVAAFVLHPLILSEGALGGRGSVLAFFVLGATWALVRWSRAEGFRDLLTCSLFLALAVLTRYEAAWLVATAMAYVTWRTHRKSEGIARTEGTLIAFLLPVAYGALVWIGANWAIMGDPWYFWRATVGAGTRMDLTGPDWLSSILWVALICCPALFGLVYHELRGVASGPLGRRAGRAAAWLAMGVMIGAALTPHCHLALGATHWLRLLTLGVTATTVGYALLAIVGGQYLGVSGKGACRPVAGSVLLVGLGLALAAWLHAMGGVAIPATPTGALRGAVAFAGDVAPERAVAALIAGRLPANRKAYLVGGPGFAVSLFAGRPAQTRVLPQADLSRLPLEAGDLLILRESAEASGLTPALRAKYLAADRLMVSPESLWSVFALRAPVRPR